MVKKKGPLRILLLAPHPFYTERGTPIACKLICESLCEQGHEVTLLTYPQGEDVEIPGLTIRRIPFFRFPFSIFNFLLRDVPIGLSVKKLCCDAMMAWQLIRMWVVERRQFDVVHAGEEAVFLAIFLGFLNPKPEPIVYDMDSSMADQVVEKFPALTPLSWFLNEMESLAFRRVQWVFPVCEALAEKIRAANPEQNYELLEDVYFEPAEHTDPVEDLRVKHKGPSAQVQEGGEQTDLTLNPANLTPQKTKNRRESQPLLILYIGNLEAYQGIDLLLEALAILANEAGALPEWQAKLIGGIPGDIERYQQRIHELGLGQHVFLLGPRPLKYLPDYLQQADLLLSPRTKGGNTPMKLYSYLASGVPIVATRIRSHTQAVDDQTAVLVNPHANDMASGLRELILNSEKRVRIGYAGRELARTRYSIQTYRKKLNRSYWAIAQLVE